MEIEINWSELKIAIQNKPNNMQFIEFSDSYTIILIDGSFICFTKLIKEDPAQGGSDQEDFENNFKNNGNNSIDSKSPLNRYIFHEMDDKDPITYVGLIDASGTWIVKKMVENVDDLTLTYANISNNATRTTFTLAWANRLTLTYNLIENLTGV